MPDMSLEQRQHALCAAIAPLAVASHLLGLGLGYLPGIAIALSLLPLLRPALTIPNAVTVARLAIPCLAACTRSVLWPARRRGCRRGWPLWRH